VCRGVFSQSDVYSLGLVIFSIVSGGKKPFFNLPWEEAVVNSMRRGEGCVLPSNDLHNQNFLNP
jgi:hypothetical protein